MRCGYGSAGIYGDQERAYEGLYFTMQKEGGRFSGATVKCGAGRGFGRAGDGEVIQKRGPEGRVTERRNTRPTGIWQAHSDSEPLRSASRFSGCLQMHGPRCDDWRFTGVCSVIMNLHSVLGIAGEKQM